MYRTTYAASMKLFQWAKNGCAAWFVLIGQYVGQDELETEIKCQEQLLHT